MNSSRKLSEDLEQLKYAQGSNQIKRRKLDGKPFDCASSDLSLEGSHSLEEQNFKL